MFSKACEYGIKATLYIAKQTNLGSRCSVKGIANAINSPEAFTAKVLQSLAKNNIIISIKGANGGYVIDIEKQQHTQLIQIVYAIDGDKIYKGCGLGLEECNENKPCPIHDEYNSVRSNLKNMLENTSIENLALGLAEGLTFLKV